MVQPRRSVAPVRKLLAALLGTIAVFIMLFGAGMQSWAIVALGVAVLVLAISLSLINVVRRGARAWVAGTAQVVSVSEPPPSIAAYGRCELQLVVAAPGLPTSAVKIRDPRVPTTKWPDVGATLPVIVAVDDMRHIRIQWDEVMTHEEAELEEEAGYGGPADDLLLDDLLTEQPAPPWVSRDRKAWARPAEPMDTSGQYAAGLAVREPGVPIVLEGTLVEHAAPPPTQRRKPSPHPRPTPAAPPPPADDDAAADDAHHGADAVQDGSDPGTAGQQNDERESAREAADRREDARIDGLITAYPSARPGPAGAIHGVGVAVVVTELDRSRRFYRETLGFHEIDNGPDNAVLASGDTRLLLRVGSGAGSEAGPAMQLNLEVGDVEAVHAELTRKGVDFVHGPRAVSRGERLELWSATLLDPDGHQVAVSQWRAVG